MTTALQIIEAAYVRSTANDPGKLAVDTELLGYLNRKFQAYFALAAASSPDAFMSSATLTLAGATVSATLPTDIISLMRVENASRAKVNIIPAIERDKSWHIAPAIFRRGTSIFSRQLTGDPIVGDVLTVDLLDAPATLATTAAALDTRWPVRFDELLVLDMAVYLSAKDEGRDAGDFQKMKDERATHASIFFKLNDISTTGRESPHDAAVRNRGEN